MPNYDQLSCFDLPWSLLERIAAPSDHSWLRRSAGADAMSGLNSIELFGGCGGLGLGLSQAGFRSRAFLEWNANAVDTVRFNANRGVPHIRDWHVEHKDVRDRDWHEFQGQLALVSGGPPCQPFGIGGLKRGANDPRDMWPEAIRAVRETRPEAFLFENVRNLAGPRFRPYLEWIEQQFRHAASEPRRASEAPSDQLERLRNDPVTYRTRYVVVNAADFGAPQIRYRVLLVGLRDDLDAVPTVPRPTHGLSSLLWDQWVSGDYWRRHGMEVPSDEAMPARVRTEITRLRRTAIRPSEKPWVTVRDAFADLGPPDGRNNHAHQPGARTYAGHTGSPLDMPAKALKAGDHGVPGGENMMVCDDGSVRYFTLRETARLVGLPDNYGFVRSWTESMRCLGNAVPVQLGKAAGLWLKENLANGKHRNRTMTMPLPKAA